MQNIVSLAFAGGSNVKNASAKLTGILNPGRFNGEPVDLLPWFNGSLSSTNLYNQPIGINWLDAGETTPLEAFLNGSTTTVEIDKGSNEFRLFAHFFRSFSFVFGCTQPPPRPEGETGPPLSLAYVHKFMNLNATHMGHFINQLTTAALHFGFSDQDSNTLESQMNARYNVRCAPGITFNPAAGPQLFSLCQADSCPLAAPSADCDAYVNLGPGGVSGPSSTGTSTGLSISSTSVSLVGSTQTVTQSLNVPPPTSSSPSSSTAANTNSKAGLTPGPIAGIAIGGAAVLFAFIALLVFLLRKRRPQSEPFGYPPSHPSYTGSPYPSSPYAGGPVPSYQGNYATSNADHHVSYMSSNPSELPWIPPPQELDTPHVRKSPEMVVRGSKRS